MTQFDVKLVLAAEEYIKKVRPKLIILSPECTMFSQMNSLNK